MAPVSRPVLLVLASGAAWLLLGLIEFGAVALTTGAPPSNALPGIATMVILGFLACLLLFWLYGLLERRSHGRRLVGAVVIACMAVTALRTLCGVCVQWFMRSGNPQSGLARRWQQVCADGLWNLAVLGLFSLLYFTIRYRLELQEQKEKTLRATALAHQAQLQMLRYQLNPHFLFNALNSIRAMILEDAGKSRKMVTTLSEFLRYSLDGDTKETTIGGEVAAIRNYLEIQRIRFERKLEVTTEIDPEAESAAIPCFLVHPLVENAVKHGMNTSAMPLRVKIQVSRFADQLRIRVLNTGRLASGDSPVGDATDGTGTGLRNIAQRLELVFPGRHSFSIRESEGWVHAEIDVALEPRVEHETVSSLDRG